MKRQRRKGGRPRKTPVSVSKPKFGGDHGPKTRLATHGTILEPILNDAGANPNNQYRRRRVQVIDTLTSLSMRQVQAAIAIRHAYCRVQQLSSGGEIKERVQASPKPDATVAAQVDANSLWVHVTRRILPSEREIVEHVCCHNLPLTMLSRRGVVRPLPRFKTAMDRVADHMRY